MSRLGAWIGIVLAAGGLAACGGDDDGSSSSGGSGGVGGYSGGGGFGGGAVGGSGPGGSAGAGGGDPYACSSTFTATGTATLAQGDPIEVALNEADGVQVVSGSSGNTRFEALYASDMPLEKAYMGPDYALLIDILDSQDDTLQPARYTELGGHGVTMSVKYADGMWHTFTLELDPANGDFVEIEEGSTALYDIVPSPQVKAAYQLSFKTYTDMGANEVEATGTLTGRFDGCYMRHNDTSGKYAQ